MRKPRLRLSLGSVRSEDRSIFARRYVLRAVAEYVPQALDQLVTISRTPRLAWSDAGVFDPATEDALRAWATRWGIPYADPWWMSDIRLQVKHWHAFPKEAGRWSGVVGSYRAIDWPTLPPWRATEETEAAFRVRVEDYIRRVKTLPGVEPVPVTFSERDFAAFVLEHVAQLPTDQVLVQLDTGDADPGDASAVRKRNRQVAALVGLRLRRRPQGRPRAKTGTRPTP